MEGCLFCKIAKKEIPARLVYEDADLFAFEDIAPQAPVHILICPRRHVSSLHALSAEPMQAQGAMQKPRQSPTRAPVLRRRRTTAQF